MMNSQKIILNKRIISLSIFLVLVVVNASGQKCLSGNCLDGTGEYQFKNGAIFNGTFENGLIKKGTILFTDSNSYTGEFKNNLKHGTGTFYNKNLKKEFNGTFENDYFVKGEIKYHDSTRYVGEYKNNKREGKGVLYTKGNKSELNGYWKSNVYVGKSYSNEVTTYVLTVGVSRYANSNINLQFAASDAGHVGKFFKTQPNTKVYQIQNEYATWRNIISALEQVAEKADENDRVVFFFSGHGSDNNIVLHDKQLSNEDLAYRFRTIKAKFKWIILDACHSQSVIETANAHKPRPTYKPVKNDIIILTSSASTEVSYEFQQTQMGLFTYVFLEGLKGYSDINHDDIILFKTELYPYLKRNVEEYSLKYFSTKQTPKFAWQVQDPRKDKIIYYVTN